MIHSGGLKALRGQICGEVIANLSRFVNTNNYYLLILYIDKIVSEQAHAMMH